MSSESYSRDAAAGSLELNAGVSVDQVRPVGSGEASKIALETAIAGNLGEEDKNASEVEEIEAEEGSAEVLTFGAKSAAFLKESWKKDEEALKSSASIADGSKVDEAHKRHSKLNEEQNREGDIIDNEADSGVASGDVKSGKGVEEKQMQRGEDLLLNECKFGLSVGDVVWGMVRSHPWWPGQIFHPSFASEMAVTHQKSDHFLVAYFEDKTFAWNDESMLKPFDSCFSHMAMQSSLDAFVSAVDAALREVARHTEIGMACGCVADKSIADLKYRKVENAGIKEGTFYPEVDRYLVMSSFDPGRLLEYIQALAMLPCGDYDKLKLVKAKTQLKAFCKSKGYPELQEFCSDIGLSENEDVLAPKAEDGKGNVEHKTEGIFSDDTSSKEKRRGRGRPPGKKNRTEGDGKKQKSLIEPMKDTVASGVKKQRSDNSDSADNGKGKRKRLDSLGDLEFMSASACHAAVAKVGKGISQVDAHSETSRSDKDLMQDYPSPSEMLSQLCSTAIDPINAYNLQSIIISFFTDWKNSHVKDSPEDENSVNLERSRRGRKKLAASEQVHVHDKSGYIHDSYWTDVVFHESPTIECPSRTRKRKAKYKVKKKKNKQKLH